MPNIGLKKLKIGFLGLAVMWVVLAILTLGRDEYMVSGVNVYHVYAGLMVGNGLMMGGLAKWWTPKKQLVKWVGYIWITLNIVLTIASIRSGFRVGT